MTRIFRNCCFSSLCTLLRVIPLLNRYEMLHLEADGSKRNLTNTKQPSSYQENIPIHLYGTSCRLHRPGKDVKKDWS